MTQNKIINFLFLQNKNNIPLSIFNTKIFHLMSICFIFAPDSNNLLINIIVMITKDLLIAFLNVQETLEVQSVKANSKRLIFTAPSCYAPIIVDTFEPTFGVVSSSDIDTNYTQYVIQ